MQRIVVTSCIVALATLLVAGTAWAGPEAGSVKPILAKTAKPTTLFGYSGQRPLDPTTRTGIARPTPAPRIQTAAFGAATQCLPARPRMVTPTPAPDYLGSASYVVQECADGSCSPCDPCAPYCPTTRVNDDPLSISPHQWSSGYHDGGDVQHRVVCQPCSTRPIYRSPCEPCAEPCDPCATRVVVRRPQRVVRRVCAPACDPCYTPCATRCYTPYRTWCAPRIRFGIAPYWGWGGGCGWGGGWGGGWGWGGGCW